MAAGTVREALWELVSRPHQTLLLRWNWKTALLSSLARGSVFFLANLPSGGNAAAAAMLTEFAFRGTTSGFYGAITQSLRRIEPAWRAVAAAFVLLPAVQHSLEFLVHAACGTARLRASLLASMAFTGLSTAVNLYLMRRGLLIVGEQGRTLRSDLAALPRAAGELVMSLVDVCRRAAPRRV